MGEYLRDADIVPGLAVASDARRAKQTLDQVLEAFPGHVTHLIENTIYLATVDHLVEILRQTPDKVATLLAVGHNPGFAELASWLAGSGEAEDLALMRSKFPTAALAMLDFESDHWGGRRQGRGATCALRHAGHSTGRGDGRPRLAQFANPQGGHADRSAPDDAGPSCAAQGAGGDRRALVGVRGDAKPRLSASSARRGQLALRKRAGAGDGACRRDPPGVRRRSGRTGPLRQAQQLLVHQERGLERRDRRRRRWPCRLRIGGGGRRRRRAAAAPILRRLWAAHRARHRRALGAGAMFARRRARRASAAGGRSRVCRRRAAAWRACRRSASRPWRLRRAAFRTRFARAGWRRMGAAGSI